MEKRLKTLILPIIISLSIHPAFAQGQRNSSNTKSEKGTFSFEIDPIVPLVLKGIGGHFIWKPKKTDHFIFGLAMVANGTLPEGILNLDSKNKNLGWHYKINQGFGLETEYYFKQANRKWFVGLQLFTEEINLTNDHVPSVSEHRTNIGMAVITVGYKWYPIRKVNLYLKPWAGIGYTGIIHSAFSSEVIDNTQVGSYKYHLATLSPFATVHIGYTF